MSDLWSCGSFPVDCPVALLSHFPDNSWATLSVRRSRLKPKMNETYTPDLHCTRGFGRLTILTSEFVDRPKSSTVKNFTRFFSLLFSILAFGICDVRAQEPHVIIHHDAALRACPDSECQVVAQLPILSPVYVKKQRRPPKPEYGKGLWTYVETTQRNRASGWTLDDHIGFPGRFRPVRSWGIRQFSYCMGDYCPEFVFTASGKFTVRYPPCFDGNCPDPPSKAPCHSETDKKKTIGGSVFCVSMGKLYRAGEAIRLGGSNSHEFMYFDRRNQLCVDMYTCQAYREKKP